MPKYVDQQSSVMPDETHSLQHNIALSYPWSKDLGSQDMSHRHYIEKDQSKREREMKFRGHEHTL